MASARVAFSLARRAPFRSSAFTSRSFASIAIRRADKKPTKWDPKPGDPEGKLISFEEINTESDLIPPGAEPGTIPTDIEQATGLERLEILGKMQGIDIFDMRPLPSDRLGTLKDPIVVRSAGEELQCGCTGVPADSHVVHWCVVSRNRPYERCQECGSVYKMEYVGPADDGHGDHGHGGAIDGLGGHGGDYHAHDEHSTYEEPKNMTNYVKPEYWYK